MQSGRPYLRQKPHLYFDENCPEDVIRHFRRASYWKNKVKTTSAFLEGNVKRSDLFHYRFCQRHRLTLVTLDGDFADDRRYPFTHGKMAGMIIVRASSSNPPTIVGLLAMLLGFVVLFPFPRGLLLETKLIATQQGVTMRGRNAATHEIKTMRIVPRQTTTQDVRLFFGY